MSGGGAWPGLMGAAVLGEVPPHPITTFMPHILMFATAFGLFFTMLLVILSPLVEKCIPGEPSHKVIGNFVATIHAVAVVVIVLYLVFWTDHYSHDILLDAEWIGQWVSSCTAGYMLYDSIQMFVLQEVNAEMVVFQFHHLVSLVTIWFCLTWRCGISFVLAGLLFELSTPLLHVCATLEQANMHKSIVYYLSCLGFLVSFIAGREVASVWQVSLVIRATPAILARNSPFQAIFIAAPFVYLTLNTYFLTLVVAKAKSVFFGPANGEKEGAARSEAQSSHEDGKTKGE